MWEAANAARAGHRTGLRPNLSDSDPANGVDSICDSAYDEKMRPTSKPLAPKLGGRGE